MSTSCHHSSKLFASAKAKQQVLGSQWFLKGFLSNLHLKFFKKFVIASVTVKTKIQAVFFD